VITVFRIGFSGATKLADLYYGSLRASGRWHTPIPGMTTSVVYTAGSRALAQLEKRVHCNGVAPVDQSLLRLELASHAVILSARDDLGLHVLWRNRETYTQSLGNAWLRSAASLGLWVPSYVEPRERNLLLNPAHPQYATHVTLSVEEKVFAFDPRMFE
jgi:RES domain-containing protein